MRPTCLIGSLSEAFTWVETFKTNKRYEIFILKDDVSVETLKNFRLFLNIESIHPKLGVIYFFNTLKAAEQAILLKILEDLPYFSTCILHCSTFPLFTIQTRSNVVYLKPLAVCQEIQYAFDLFKIGLENNSLSKQKICAFRYYFDTLNLHMNRYILDSEKDTIIKDLTI